MSSNFAGHSPALKKIRHELTMAEFDRLPRYVRDHLNYTTLKLTLRPTAVAALQAGATRLDTSENYIAGATLLAYGPDHPGAPDLGI